MDLIGFSEQDDMYVLGDMVDRGPDPIPLLQDLLLRPNIYPMLGNHEYMAMEVLRKLNTEITEENFESHLSEDDFMNYMYWMEEGGDTTVNQFARLDEAARGTILEYLEECAVYEELKIKGRKYVLVHADVPLHAEADVDAEPVRERENVSPESARTSADAVLRDLRDRPDTESLDGCNLVELVFHRADYGRRYFQDENTFLVTGHTPTPGIRGDRRALVYEGHGHVAIDCGCVFGGNLAAYRLDDGEAFYVAGHVG